MNALLRISEEDPTCQVEKSVEGKQLIVHCMGDVHLDHIMNKMERKYGIKAVLQDVYIPYRETIKGKATAAGWGTESDRRQWGNPVLQRYRRFVPAAVWAIRRYHRPQLS